MNKPDVLVIGAGLAGMMAAITALNEGCTVTMLSAGNGVLTLASGNIDLLGYAQGQMLASPWDGLSALPDAHPYSQLDRQEMHTAIDLFCQTVTGQQWPYKTHPSEQNILVPTMIGTLKPTWLVPHCTDIDALSGAQRVLVVGVQGLRESSPALVMRGLRQCTGWRERTFSTMELPSPLSDAHRSINTLDIARFVDRPEGRQWILRGLQAKAGSADIVLLPPICGSQPDLDLWQELIRAAQAPLVELLSIPPGVGGLRLWQALRKHLDSCSRFECIENAKVIRAINENHQCRHIVVEAAGSEYIKQAKTFVIATGGILGGGVELAPGKVRESIYGIPIDAPEDMAAWSATDIFDKHLFSRLGVAVDKNMRSRENTLDNVFFAGRTLGGYDYATEKSGHGVALTTGWKAGQSAARTAKAMGEQS